MNHPYLLLFVLTVAFTSNIVVGQAQISIFAGSSSNPVAPRGYLGDGGLATLNPPPFYPVLFWPSGVHVDSIGNIYISDNRNQRIRKVSKDSGNITTIAGNGYEGYSGDGGLAVNARLSTPTHVMSDLNGNVYISDNGNHVIRMINVTTGIITTVAGIGSAGYNGDLILATMASLNSPNGLAISNNKLFISDTNNHRIRIVDLETRIISTLAGNGTAGYYGDSMSAELAMLNKPQSVDLDSIGNIYFADQGNNRIRMINGSSLLISTIAGTGTVGSSGDNGPATSALLSGPYSVAIGSNDVIYICDGGNNRIRKVSGGIISLVSTWNTPFGIDVDSNDNIFVAGYFSSLVMVYNSTSTLSTTVAGTNGVRGYYGDGGPAVPSDYYLPLLWYPQNSKLDSEGNLYIADANGHRIRMVNTSGIISTLVPSLNFPYDIAIWNSSLFYFTDFQSHVVKVYKNGVVSVIGGTGTSGYTGDGIPATSSKINNPVGIGLDGLGNVYFSDSSNHRIRFIDITTGNISTLIGTGVAGYNGDGIAGKNAKVNGPYGIFVSSLGDVYFTDTGNNRVRLYNASTGNISTIAGTGVNGYSPNGVLAINSNLGAPQGLFVDSYGNIFIADTSNQVVRVVNAVTGLISTIAGTYAVTGYSGDGGIPTNAHLFDPVGVTVSPNGDVFITEKNNQIVRKVSFSCNGRGIVKGATCACTNGYGGEWCQYPTCFGISSSNSTVCNGNGVCSSPNNCSCNATFAGDQCQYAMCNGISSNDSSVCNSNGKCIAPDVCNCNSTFSGQFCQFPITCFGLAFNHGAVCGGRGACLKQDTCSCSGGYFGVQCENYSCFGGGELFGSKLLSTKGIFCKKINKYL